MTALSLLHAAPALTLTPPDAGARLEPATATGPRLLVVASLECASAVRDVLPEGSTLDHVPDAVAAQSALARDPADVVIVDLAAVPASALAFLLAAPQLAGHTQVLVIAARPAMEDARAAVQSGADCCVLRPFTPDDLRRTIARAAEAAAARSELLTLRTLAESPADRWLVGRSPLTLRMRELVVRAAAQRSPVLVLGEPGVGKKHVAQALHLLSNRHRRPFVLVSCTGRTPAALEAALFGEGQDRGALAEVSGGTLVLEEADQLPAPLVARLAQLLSLQGTGRSHVPDFRLVATVTERITPGVTPHEPRSTLRGQVRVVPVVVPPLRERRADIPLLVSALKTRIARQLAMIPPFIPPELVATLMSRDWPGNVRQLEECVAQLFLTPAVGRATLEREEGRPAGDDPMAMVEAAARRQWSMAELEREYILRVLATAHGHRSQAADILGIDRRTLYRKLKEYDAATPDEE